MKVTTEEITQRIRDLWEEKNEMRLDDNLPKLTYKNLEEKTGIREAKIKQFMRKDGRTIEQIHDMVKLADALEVSPYYLLTENEEKNHVVCEELGLSNDAVVSLSELNLMAKAHEGQEQEYYSNLLKTVDILIMNQDLLATLSGYFFNDFSQFAVINEKGFSTIQLTNGGTYTIEDNANRFRLRIMDKLKTIRDELKGESNNETGKW